LRDATLSGWVIFVADVDYYEMSSKISPKSCPNFSRSSSTASGITLKMLRGLINRFSQILVCNALGNSSARFLDPELIHSDKSFRVGGLEYVPIVEIGLGLVVRKLFLVSFKGFHIE
jgi:hypothetical protein